MFFSLGLDNFTYCGFCLQLRVQYMEGATWRKNIIMIRKRRNYADKARGCHSFKMYMRILVDADGMSSGEESKKCKEEASFERTGEEDGGR